MKKKHTKGKEGLSVAAHVGKSEDIFLRISIGDQKWGSLFFSHSQVGFGLASLHVSISIWPLCASAVVPAVPGSPSAPGSPRTVCAGSASGSWAGVTGLFCRGRN